MCVSFFFFIFFFPLLFLFCSELPLYFPSEGKGGGGGGMEDGISWLASFLPIMAQILYIYLSKQANKQTKSAKKQTSAVCCMPGNCKREGRGGSCSNVSLVSLSLPRTHAHTHPHHHPAAPYGIPPPPPKRCGAAALGCPHVAHPPLEDAR